MVFDMLLLFGVFDMCLILLLCCFALFRFFFNFLICLSYFCYACSFRFLIFAPFACFVTCAICFVALFDFWLLIVALFVRVDIVDRLAFCVSDWYCCYSAIFELLLVLLFLLCLIFLVLFSLVAFVFFCYCLCF